MQCQKADQCSYNRKGVCYVVHFYGLLLDKSILLLRTTKIIKFLVTKRGLEQE